MCWTFDYPGYEDNLSRYASLEFEIPLNVTIHGFLGYFRSVLYKEIF